MTRLADRALFGTFDVATGLGARAATGAESLMIRGLTTSVRMGMNPAVAIPAAIDAAEGFISPTPPENLEQLGGFAASKARGFTIKQ